MFAWKGDRGKPQFITLQEDSLTCLACTCKAGWLHAADGLPSIIVPLICAASLGSVSQGSPGTATTPATVVCVLSTLFHCPLVFSTSFFICPVWPENPEIRHKTEKSLEWEEVDQPTKKPPSHPHLKYLWTVEETDSWRLSWTSHSRFFHVFVLKTYLICAVQKYFIRIFKSTEKEHRAQLEEKWNCGTKQGTQIINGSKGISLEWLHSTPLVEKWWLVYC